MRKNYCGGFFPRNHFLRNDCATKWIDFRCCFLLLCVCIWLVYFGWGGIVTIARAHSDHMNSYWLLLMTSRRVEVTSHCLIYVISRPNIDDNMHLHSQFAHIQTTHINRRPVTFDMAKMLRIDHTNHDHSMVRPRKWPKFNTIGRNGFGKLQWDFSTLNGSAQAGHKSLQRTESLVRRCLMYVS